MPTHASGNMASSRPPSPIGAIRTAVLGRGQGTLRLAIGVDLFHGRAGEGARRRAAASPVSKSSWPSCRRSNGSTPRLRLILLGWRPATSSAIAARCSDEAIRSKLAASLGASHRLVHANSRMILSSWKTGGGGSLGDMNGTGAERLYQDRLSWARG